MIDYAALKRAFPKLAEQKRNEIKEEMVSASTDLDDFATLKLKYKLLNELEMEILNSEVNV